MPRTRQQWDHLKSFLLGLVRTKTRFVLTCRAKNYTTELAYVPGLYRVDLQDLNPQQIYEILRRYLPGDGAEDTHSSGSDAVDSIWEEVLHGAGVLDAWEAWAAEGGSVRTFWERPEGYSWQWNLYEKTRGAMHSDPCELLLLCRNPFTMVHLLMPMIYNLAAAWEVHGISRQAALDLYLPNNRAKLFGKVIDGMLEAESKRQPWIPEDGEAAQDQKWVSGDVDQVKRTLERAASALELTEQRTEMRFVELEELADWPSKGEELLKKGRDAGLVTLSDNDTGIRFNHQLFQEYFATRRLRDLLEDYDRRHPGWEAGPSLPPRDDRLAELFPEWWDVGGWRITVALLGEFAPEARSRF